MDFYVGSGQWSFDNGTFAAEMVGGTVTPAGAPVAAFNAVFTIVSVESGTLVTMTPEPAVADGTPVEATSIALVYTPAAQFNAGPQIVGVSLIPEVKDGMNKLGSDRRAT
jgi:hypothetical protein